MPVKYKVIETFNLDDEAGEPELVEAIISAATVPFDLSAGYEERGVRFVALVREGDNQSEQEDETPEKPKTANKGCQTQDSQWREQDRQWTKSDWQDRQRQDSNWQDRQRQESSGSGQGVAGRAADREWQESDWQWQGGNPCHVCGKVRADHPGKRFCDVQATKRARV